MTLVIEDRNDCSPVFVPNRILLKISELSPVGTSFVIPTANDHDGSKFSVQKYKLETEDKNDWRNFNNASLPTNTIVTNVAPELKLTLMERLDREQKDGYHLRVVAVDGGELPLSGTLLIEVAVLDENDNRPKFNRPIYEANITENAAYQTVVVQVSATDADVGDNGRVFYGFPSNGMSTYGRMFDVNNITGEIRVISKLDRETKPVHHLTVTAADYGTNSLPVEVSVVVRLIDQNDNEPKVAFRNVAEASNAETTKLCTFLGHVMVDDLDEGVNGQFNCSLDSKYADGFARFGQSSALQSLDREEKDLYEFRAVVVQQTMTKLSSTCQVTVRVEDENDCGPIFSKNEFIFTMFEENLPGTEIGTVYAFDKDEYPNNQMHFELISDEFIVDDRDDIVFRIEKSSGKIWTESVLDRELKSDYYFKVLVRDLNNSTITNISTVLIKLIDINDNSPVFRFPNKTHHHILVYVP
ncbi:hypothetical protein HELRODRAFT_69097, partial [Helobdella robusta]|uniref:Cadherin domain-containing protein n=1 Tax=Helobdella robusta TaxID=6412 RepID=T1FZP6_HELRO